MAQRRACVTGGSRGIGRAIAAALTAAGHRVTIVGRDDRTLAAAVSDGVAADAIALDVTEAETLADAVAGGAFDLLVNNAGTAETGAFLKADREALRRMMRLNVEAPANAIRAALPHMLAQGFGRIVTVASTAGLKGYAYVSAYAAAKHAVVGLTRSLALEFATTGVTINAICPGYTDTDLVADGVSTVMARTGRSEGQARAHFESSNPMKRLMRPEEVADAAVWLTGASASAITGQCIVVAGGEL